jgi:hypothetical protein
MYLMFLSNELYEISIEQLIERMIPSVQSSESNEQHMQITPQVTQEGTPIALQSALNRVRMRRLIQERKQKLQKLAVETKIIHLTLFAMIYCVIIMIFY